MSRYGMKDTDVDNLPLSTLYRLYEWAVYKEQYAQWLMQITGLRAF